MLLALQVALAAGGLSASLRTALKPATDAADALRRGETVPDLGAACGKISSTASKALDALPDAEREANRPALAHWFWLGELKDMIAGKILFLLVRLVSLCHCPRESLCLVDERSLRGCDGRAARPVQLQLTTCSPGLRMP